MSGEVRNPFRDRTMRDNFVGACKAYESRSRDLFWNGERRRSLAVGGSGYGSSFATHFWNGYDDVSLRPGEKQTVGYAWYAAGRAIAKQEQQS